MADRALKSESRYLICMLDSNGRAFRMNLSGRSNTRVQHTVRLMDNDNKTERINFGNILSMSKASEDQT